jgi:hypothetical protein
VTVILPATFAILYGELEGYGSCEGAASLAFTAWETVEFVAFAIFFIVIGIKIRKATDGFGIKRVQDAWYFVRLTRSANAVMQQSRFCSGCAW